MLTICISPRGKSEETFITQSNRSGQFVAQTPIGVLVFQQCLLRAQSEDISCVKYLDFRSTDIVKSADEKDKRVIKRRKEGQYSLNSIYGLSTSNLRRKASLGSYLGSLRGIEQLRSLIFSSNWFLHKPTNGSRRIRCQTANDDDGGLEDWTPRATRKTFEVS
ncbi:hypothetical protein AVEN_6251-1 [Araneus ventricosus]|uniref:Uncharacterized protein n=1 Tax=Araneus ventricosus TaxID=182803 RepID=A0A4Y2PCG9_ARAVE|nr:hypothetical protein AVEN_6251-1 [Araneus ventricosus]